MAELCESWWWGKTVRSLAGDCTGVVELIPKRISVSQAKDHLDAR